MKQVLCIFALLLPAWNALAMSPSEIWEGYDPRAEPLEEEVLRSWKDEGVSYKEVYFNGEKFDGKHVRIYGIYAAPEGGKKLPALLHIHGGGQTVNEDWLEEFTGRGYAILSINWGGEWPRRERYTLWNDVPNGDHQKRKGRNVTEPSPRSDAYFLWIQACMRSVTYLEQQAEVDPEKIGAFGISMGGSIMWNLAFDTRIKAGCAIYGAGWNTYSNKDPKYALGHPPNKPSENDLRWRTSLAPEASAPFVRFPMLFLSSSNDRHGYMDRAEDALALIPEDVPRAWALTPRFRHHIGADFIHTLPAWMDFHLKGAGSWPENPKTKIFAGEGGAPVLSVRPDQASGVEKIEVFYALENPYGVNGHWRNAEVKKAAENYSAMLPVMDANEYLFAFANLHYRSGVVISSSLEAIVPSKLGAVATIKAPSRVFYDGEEGVGAWTSNSTGTDPIPRRAGERLKGVGGPDGKAGFTAERVSPMTYAPSDPEFRAPKGASLQFDIKTEEAQVFEVNLHRNYWVDDFHSYSAELDLKGQAGWQTVTLSGDEFLDDKSGEALGDAINEIGVLELSPQKKTWQDPKVIFRNFRWVGGEYVPHVHAYRKGKANSGNRVTDSDDAGHLQDHEAVKE